MTKDGHRSVEKLIGKAKEAIRPKSGLSPIAVCVCVYASGAGERSSRLDEQRAGSKMSTGCDSQRVSVAPRYIVVRRVSGRVAPWVEALRPSGVKAFHEGGGACVLGCGLWTKRRSQDGDKWRRPECAVEATRLGDNEQRSTAW